MIASSNSIHNSVYSSSIHSGLHNSIHSGLHSNYNLINFKNASTSTREISYPFPSSRAPSYAHIPSSQTHLSHTQLPHTHTSSIHGNIHVASSQNTTQPPSMTNKRDSVISGINTSSNNLLSSSAAHISTSNKHIRYHII